MRGPDGNFDGSDGSREGQPISSSALGVIIFIATELMFFAALISAYTVISAQGGEWPPADQPRLPVAATALNSLFLLASGVTMFLGQRAYRAEPYGSKSFKLLGLTLFLGCVFTALQGREWAQLLSHGLTISSSAYGSFFYLIIGAHSLHVIGGIVSLLRLFWGFKKRRLKANSYVATSLFWFFVVGIWPVLYILVYLN